MGSRCRRGTSNADKLRKYSKRTRVGCVVWVGGLFASGYGSMHCVTTQKTRRVHVVAYEEAYGPVPDGLVVTHTCDNKLCINPRHLVAGTMKQNVKEAWERGLCTATRGEDHKKSKLTEDEVRGIRASKTSNSVTAKKYGVSIDTVWKIRSRRAWKHVL